MTIDNSLIRSQRPKWWASRRVLLIAISLLAAVVLIRLGFMIYWVASDTGAQVTGRLPLFTGLAAVALALLSRFAWQVWISKHPRQ